MSNQNIHVGGSIQGSALGDNNTVSNTNSFNAADQQKKELLEKLTRDVDSLLEQLPPEKKAEVADDLKMLTQQATAEKPNRKWYSVSAEGLIEASKWTKDFGGNIFGTVGQIGKLIWPDFSPPKAE